MRTGAQIGHRVQAGNGDRLVESELAVHVHQRKPTTQTDSHALAERKFDIRSESEPEKVRLKPTGAGDGLCNQRLRARGRTGKDWIRSRELVRSCVATGRQAAPG